MQENLSEVGAILIRVYCSLKTAQKKQENLRKGDFVNSCHKVFLTEVFCRKAESNRIDFPEESLMK